MTTRKNKCITPECPNLNIESHGLCASCCQRQKARNRKIDEIMLNKAGFVRLYGKTNFVYSTNDIDWKCWNKKYKWFWLERSELIQQIINR